MKRDWELSAACRNQDAELWFSSRTQARAVEICRTCPVLLLCRAAVLKREDGLPRCQRSGIIAGLTGSQRYDLARAAAGATLPPAEIASAAVGVADRIRQEPAPCGTRAAYQRHLRRREPVDEACRAANARSAGRYRRTGSTRRQQPEPAPSAR
ncbi:WhiB family transcriptional regulator [Streptomyces mangrovisoli]|uniref:4Fe-4S Wbl-type domain-containing protein n=1 Tax=Streptomyces mangrovisoli TaxID=1428628 RepID=A0A1J4NKA3_9ACTN|nr:WhiB family transcriptional regulator [Streptomyces mangrovisoli]OIJ62727.1 hypothetical protein WN71_037915 [Streptomyces mangrovisoli]